MNGYTNKIDETNKKKSKLFLRISSAKMLYLFSVSIKLRIHDVFVDFISYVIGCGTNYFSASKIANWFVSFGIF